MVDFRCPNCNHTTQVPAAQSDETITQLSCARCRSKFLLATDETEAFRFGAGQMIAHFEVLGTLGEGGFGTVFKARDTKLDRLVAVKWPRDGRLSHSESQVFLREAQAAAQVRHPHLVQVHEIGQHQGAYYIVSEYIQGVNLAEWLKCHQPTGRQTAELVLLLCQAVHAAHAANVVHRDLKPSNVLMDENDKPHITDFGLAKRDCGQDVSITRSGRVIGTPLYMSPEQARGDTNATSHLSDIYSLGVILYEMLTGATPFCATNSTTLLHRIITEEPVPPRGLVNGLDRDLNTICLKALCKEPWNRYRTALEMADDLQRYVNGEPIRARRARLPERGWRWARRHRLVVGLSGGIGCLAVAVCILLLRSGPNQTPGPPAHPVRITFSLSGNNLPPSSVGNWAMIPLDDETRLPNLPRTVRVANAASARVELAPGNYLVVLEVPNFGFHEVYRYVPQDPQALPGSFNHNRWQLAEDGIIDLPAINVRRAEAVTANMVLVNGGSFVMGAGLDGMSPAHTREVTSYYLDVTEVSTGDLVKVFRSGTPESDEATRDSYPAVNVSWHLATAYAEAVGKRLMSEVEYEYAATNLGTTKYPWGDDGDLIVEWTYGPVGAPAFDTSLLGIKGLFSNVAEWTSSVRIEYPGGKPIFEAMAAENLLSRAVRGGPQNAALTPGRQPPWSGGVQMRQALRAVQGGPTVGFRCAKSRRPPYLDAQPAADSTGRPLALP